MIKVSLAPPSRLATLALAVTLLGPGSAAAQTVSDFVRGPGSQVDGRNGEVRVDVADSPRSSSEDEAPTHLRVESTPSDASVYLNFTYVGRAPLDIKNLAPGSYRLVIAGPGHHSAQVQLELQPEKTLKVRAVLQRQTGFVELDIQPKGGVLLIDGEPPTAFPFELPTGRREIRIRLFGYEEAVRIIAVESEKTVKESIRLAPARFDIGAAGLDRGRFNPTDPGRAGSVALGFHVTTTGTGLVRVLSPDGRMVAEAALGPFTDWRQEWRWNGRDDAGRPVPGGRYRILLSTADAAGASGPEREFAVDVDSSIEVRYREAGEGVAGLLFAPDTTTLPPLSFQLGSLTAAAIDSGSEDHRAFHSFAVSGRLGLVSGLEASAAGLLLVEAREEAVVAARAGLKYRLAEADFAGGLVSVAPFVRGGYASDERESAFDTGPGAELGLAAEFRVGWLAVLAAPTAGVDGEGFLGTGRFGLLADAGVVALGASAAWDGRMARLGLEAQGLVAGTVYLRLAGAVAWSENGTALPYIGGGLGFVY